MDIFTGRSLLPNSYHPFLSIDSQVLKYSFGEIQPNLDTFALLNTFPNSTGSNYYNSNQYYTDFSFQ